MKLGRSSRVVLLLLAGLMVGYFIGPPIVHAATSLVTIQGGGSTHKARVDSKGRLSVNTEAATLADGSMLTTSFTAPLGELLIFSQAGGGGGSLGVDATLLSSVIVNNAGDTSTDVNLTADDPDCDGSLNPDLIWNGTVAAGGHLMDSPEGGMFSCGDLTVNVSPNNTGLRLYLYGFTFTGAAANRAAADHRAAGHPAQAGG